jgi:hypothetical protein
MARHEARSAVDIWGSATYVAREIPLNEERNRERNLVRDTYLKFAEEEARDKSPLYRRLSLCLAQDQDLIAFLSGLPPAKRQPNLLLAAVRYLAKSTLDWDEFKRFVLNNDEQLRALMLARSTQTNEPARCSVLLPLLAMLPGPLALLEVGASAGLCLLPDHYRYDYNGHRLDGPYAGPRAPLFQCHVEGSMPLPRVVPQIVWRAGLDLNPLDVTSQEDVEWLEALVWPEQEARLERLRLSIEAARSQPPLVRRGDLRNDLAKLASEAPTDATLVVFHTAVLVYLASQKDRNAFAESVGRIAHHWISNEWASVFPQHELTLQTLETSRFLLMLNGRAAAWTDPHGTSMQWVREVARFA